MRESGKPRNLLQEKREGHWEGWIRPTLAEFGEAATKGTVETIAALGSGMFLWPISKLRGVGELLRGKSEEEARAVEEEIASKGYQPTSESARGASEMIGAGFDLGLTPARMAGEGMTELVGPRAGYLTELGGELATFKMAHGVKAKGTEVAKQHATAKAMLGKKLSELTQEEKLYVNKIAEAKASPRNLAEEERKIKQTETEIAYEKQKDIWLGNRDERMLEADIESRLLKKEIVGEKANPIRSAAFKMPDGTIYEGATHPAIAIEQIEKGAVKSHKSFYKAESGFVTVDGDFITKEMALELVGKSETYAIGGPFETPVQKITNVMAKNKKTARQIDAAIQLYIDTKRNPAHVTELYDKLTPEQKKVVDLSQNLPNYALRIADKIEQSYKDIGTQGLDAAVLKNTIDNYASRKWDLGPDKSDSGQRKFGTTTGHAKARKYETIIEGWADGRELKIKTATENLREYKKEIVKTIEDKRFVESLRKLKTLEGEPLLSTRQLEGYKEVEHRNMVAWEWAGKVEEGKTYGKNFFATEDGQLFERRRLYAPKAQAKNLNNMLGISKLEGVPGMIAITKFNAITKAWILQSSLFHHQAFMRSYYLPGADWGQLKTPRAAYKEGIRSIETADPVLMHGVRNGLTLGLKQDWSEALLREKTWVGRVLDKTKATKEVKDGINNFREAQAEFLFGELGAGLKAKSYMETFRHQIEKYPNENPDIIAKRVASLINDDYGGLHLQRLGRNPTTQHIFRLAALAPDWCVPADTRAMTKTGWKYHHELEVGIDEVMAFDPKTKTLRWSKLNDKYVNDRYSGKMVQIKNVNRSILMTPDHTCYVYNSTKKKYETVKAKELQTNHQIPRCAEFPAPETATYDDMFVRLVGWGHHNNKAEADYNGTIWCPSVDTGFWLAEREGMVFITGNTESNIRTMVKTLANKNKSQRELYLYRRFWGGVVLKGVGITALANYAMSGGDVDKMKKDYEQAWRDGNFNWAKVNITPIYEVFTGGDRRKYFSVFGHFQDPAKFIRDPIGSAKHKQSVVGGMGFEALSGTDWAGRGFTTIEDLISGEGTVKWGNKKGPIDYDQFPSYVLSQIMGAQPIQVQNLLGYIAGETDGFDAISNSIGLRTTSTYEKKTKRLKNITGVR